MRLVPITFSEARAFVQAHHRHHRPPLSHKFSLAVALADQVVGVVIAGRPVARGLDDDFTLEVTRCCTDGTPNACSLLYGAARRVAKEMGYRRIVTYTLASESGTSLRASGWTCVAELPGRSWNCRSRPRNDQHPTTEKRRWECLL